MVTFRVATFRGGHYFQGGALLPGNGSLFSRSLLLELYSNTQLTFPCWSDVVFLTYIPDPPSPGLHHWTDFDKESRQ